MKNLQSILIAFTLIIATSLTAVSQSFETYLKHEGVETIASLAHPTNTYKKGYFTMQPDGAVVEIHYGDRVKTKLKLTIVKGWVTSIDVLYDNDWWPPFAGTALIKDVLYEMAKEDLNTSNNIISQFENYMGGTFQSFSGEQVSMALITLGYAIY